MHNHETDTSQHTISIRYSIRLKAAITRQGLVSLPQEQDNTCLKTKNSLVSLFHWRSTTCLTTLPTLPDARSHLLPLI